MDIKRSVFEWNGTLSNATEMKAEKNDDEFVCSVLGLI